MRAHDREAADPAAVASAYDAMADAYDARYAQPRLRARSALLDAPQLALARGASRVLELGCGTGRLLVQAEATVRLGVDVSQQMVRRARDRGIAVARADAHALPFGDGAFDAVLAGKGVFRYLDYSRAFAECARVLRPGGRLGVHQYAARTWSPRSPRSPGARARAAARLHVGELDELRAPARDAGLSCDHEYLWRSIRLRPYLLRIPTWLPGRWWSHCVLVFRKVHRARP
jgi:ubiquinone/menaquinone biosynthesis C-methylase UbiE